MSRLEIQPPNRHESPIPELARSSEPRWSDSTILNQVWDATPSVVQRFDEIVTSSQMNLALEAAAELASADFQQQLARDLRASYGDLGEDCPTTIAEMIERAEVIEQSNGTIGNPRDYLMQRLMTVGTMLDFLRQLGKLPESLQKSFTAETERLARFLLAVERFEQPQAMAAK